jgi:hypothetical protein
MVESALALDECTGKLPCAEAMHRPHELGTDWRVLQATEQRGTPTFYKDD